MLSGKSGKGEKGKGKPTAETRIALTGELESGWGLGSATRCLISAAAFPPRPWTWCVDSSISKHRLSPWATGSTLDPQTASPSVTHPALPAWPS